MEDLSGFSTDQKVILRICATILMSVIIVVSVNFIDNRINGYWRMVAFNKCLESNEKLVRENKSSFSPLLNNCTLIR